MRAQTALLYCAHRYLILTCLLASLCSIPMGCLGVSICIYITMNKHSMTHKLVESWRSCTWFMRSTIIFYIISYRLLGEPGAAGLRAPPQSVGNPQPDLDNASEGKASKERNSGGAHRPPDGVPRTPAKDFALCTPFPYELCCFCISTMEVKYAA